jgi:hypothetical protein
MPKYHVRAEFDITVKDVAAVQQFAHEWFSKQFAGNEVESSFVDTPEQAADLAAQNVNWAVTIVVQQILAQGALQVSGGGDAVKVSDLSLTNDAPSGPA